MKRGKTKALIIALLVGFFVFVLWFFRVLQGVENVSYDSLFHVRGVEKPSDKIAIIALDEESFKYLGRWPWTRRYYAQIIEKLTQAGAKSIIFDIIYPEAETENPGADEAFGMASKKSGIVVLASHFQYDDYGNPKKFILPVKPLAENSQMGFSNIVPELDGVCRKIPLYKLHDGKVVPSLAMAGLSIYYGKSIEQIVKEKNVALDNYKEMLINYAGGYEVFPYYSFHKVLKGDISCEKFKDKIVIIGGTASGLFDFKAIPFSHVFPGVEIHANTMSNILEGNFLRPWPPVVTFGFLVLFALFTGIVTTKLSPLKGGMLSVIVLGGYYLLVFWLFKNKNIYGEFVAPASSLGLSYVGVLLFRLMTEEKEKGKIKKTFSQYLNPYIMDKVLSDPTYLKLGGHNQRLTVLFSDIRGFTTITEALPPEELVSQLNEYLSKMVEIVFKHDGTMDKFIGDAVMAFWGAPIPMKDHAKKGVLAAIEMHKELKFLQDKWRAEDKKIFEIGVGVNTGDMTVGNMGSKEKMDYTVIGDNVNLGARLESLNKEYHSKLIISEFTYAEVKDLVDVKLLGSVKVKGKTKPVEIYAVLGKKGEEPIISADEIKKDEKPKEPAKPVPGVPKLDQTAKFDPNARVDFGQTINQKPDKG